MTKNRAKTPPKEAPVRIRVCKNCGAVVERGPVPYDWDCHSVRDAMGMPVGELFMSCSASCRADMGLPERKHVFAAPPIPEPAPWPDEIDWFSV